MRTKRPAQIVDLAATKPYIERHPGVVDAVELAGIRSGTIVPMLKDQEVGRHEPLEGLWVAHDDAMANAKGDRLKRLERERQPRTTRIVGREDSCGH